MQRVIALIAVVLTILVGSFSTAVAQNSTPVAGGETDAVTIFGSDGRPAGEIVVDAIVDPFEDYDRGSAPQRGFHYVMASVTITATDAPIDASSYNFSIVDTDGFIYNTTYLYRGSDAAGDLPDFPGGTIEPGDSMSGAVFFQVLDGPTVGFIIYQPTYETMITAADLRDAPVEQGDEVEFLASDGRPAATLTVDGVISPLEDYDSSYAPQRGFQYVGVQVTIENTGSGDLAVDSYNFTLADTEGFLYYSYGVYRSASAEAQIPSLQYSETVPAGGSITGLVTFQVLAGTEPGLIYYSPSSDRQIRLAEYGEGQAPRPSDTPLNPRIGTDETPEANVTRTSTADCSGVIAWAEATAPNITIFFNSFEVIGGAFAGQFDGIDPDAVRDAAETIGDAADAQAEIDDVPEVAQAAHDVFIDALDQSVTILNDFADAIEADDQAAMAAAVADITNLLTADEGMSVIFEQLSEDCPEIESVDIE